MPDTKVLSLHDQTSSPWCPKCGLRPEYSLGYGLCIGHMGQRRKVQPGIFTRLPESMPEGLEPIPEASCGTCHHFYLNSAAISDAHAEKLLVGHWVKKYPKVIFNCFLKNAVGADFDAATEDFVVALHRFCDAQESKP